MKVTACLSWFEESPSWLGALVTSMKGFADRIVAVDGAYLLYPDAIKHPVSGPEQAEAILHAAKAAGIECTLHVPAEPWTGNETGKRSFLFDLGNRVSTPHEDWLFIVDGDDIVDRVPFDARKRLEETDLDVAEVSLWWREDWEESPEKATIAKRLGGEAPDEWTVNHRALIRAIPGLRCGYAHMIYELPDGRRLRGMVSGDDTPLEPALDLTDLRVEHKHPWRNPARTKAADAYYEIRDAYGVELAEQPTDERLLDRAAPELSGTSATAHGHGAGEDGGAAGRVLHVVEPPDVG